MIRRQIRVSGLVQCVGFRWFARQNAALLGLTGWVRNEPDGAVLMEVQGGFTAVDSFARAVSQGPVYAQVDRVEARNLPTDPEERSFQVRDDWI